ncbi:fibronectin type III domain-containing protein [Calditrichota bacterium]
MKWLNAFVKIFIILSLTMVGCDLGNPSSPDNNNPDNPTKPLAPEQVTAYVQSETEALIEWHDMSENESGFVVYLRSGAITAFDTVGYTSADTTHFALALEPGTAYDAKIAAYNDHGASLSESIASFSSADVVPTVPGTPRVESVTATQVRLSWQDNSANESGFFIYMAESDSSGNGDYIPKTTVLTDLTSIIIADLKVFQTYSFRISAFNRFGESDHSSFTIKTTGDFPPQPPRNLSIETVSPSEFRITWEDYSQNEESFQLEQSQDATFQEVQSIDLAADESEYLIDSLTPQTEYFFRVRAVNRFGNSDYSSIRSLTTVDVTPSPPLNVHHESHTPDGFDLLWTDDSDNETGFIAELRDNNTNILIRQDTLDANVESYTAENLTPFTAYKYKIHCFNSYGTASPEEYQVAHAGRYIPRSPDTLIATPGSMTMIDLSWQDNADNEEFYELEGKQEGYAWIHITELPANSTQYSVQGLAPGTNYRYRLRVGNRFETSNYLESSQVMTYDVPVAPAWLIAEPATDSAIRLIWQDNNTHEQAYLIEYKTDREDAFRQLDSIPANSEEYIMDGLNQYDYYFFRIRAMNAFGYSGYSIEASSTTTGLIAFVVCGFSEAVVIDVSDPYNPAIMEQFYTAGNAQKVEIYKSHAVLAELDAGVSVYDLTNPGDIMRTTRFSTQGRARNLQIYDNFIYVADDYSGLTILDAGDLTELSEVSNFDLEGSVYDVAVDVDYVFLAAGTGGFVILDVESPWDPQQAGYLWTSSAAYGIEVSPTLAYIADYQAGLTIIDIQDPDSPTTRGNAETPGYALDLKVHGNYAFIADYWDGMTVMDVSDPTNPQEAAFFDTPGQTHCIAIYNDIAYLADHSYGLRIVDISTPTAPFDISSIETPGNAIGVAIHEYK